MTNINRIAIILLFIIAIACAPLPEDTDNHDCYGFHNVNVPIVSINPCLRGDYTTDLNHPTIQAVPSGWQLYNVLTDADGAKTLYVERARIIPNEFGLTVIPHNGMWGIAGKWGYTQAIDFDIGCYLLKVTGRGYVNDPRQEQNFAVSGYLGVDRLSQQVLPRQDGFELIFPFEITWAGERQIRFLIEALWGTAGHGSEIDILSAGVLKVGYGYCEQQAKLH
jgi:hypothetical protein